jgi:HD-GYP domain-containing protein (c-di-GMP phosphodiesterase class II)
MSATPQPRLDAPVAPFTLISAESGSTVALDELTATGPAVLAWVQEGKSDDPRGAMLRELGERIASSSARLVLVSDRDSELGRDLAARRAAEWLTDPSGEASRALGLLDERRMRRPRRRDGVFVVDQQLVLRLAFISEEAGQWIPASFVSSRLTRLGSAALTTTPAAANPTAVGESELESLVRAVGRELGLSPNELTQLATAGRFRDLGMSVVPDEIITKEGPCSDEEWAIVRQHPQRSAEMLGDSPLFAPVREIVRASHEHIDGSGYPNGLSGDQIPIGARILLAAEAYIAIAYGRSYQEHERPEQPLAELRTEVGTLYDPAVMDALTTVLRADSAPAAITQIV